MLVHRFRVGLQFSHGPERKVLMMPTFVRGFNRTGTCIQTDWIFQNVAADYRYHLMYRSMKVITIPTCGHSSFSQASSLYLPLHSLMTDRILPILLSIDASTVRRASLVCQKQMCIICVYKIYSIFSQQLTPTQVPVLNFTCKFK